MGPHISHPSPSVAWWKHRGVEVSKGGNYPEFCLQRLILYCKTDPHGLPQTCFLMSCSHRVTLDHWSDNKTSVLNFTLIIQSAFHDHGANWCGSRGSTVITTTVQFVNDMSVMSLMVWNVSITTSPKLKLVWLVVKFFFHTSRDVWISDRRVQATCLQQPSPLQWQLLSRLQLLLIRRAQKLHTPAFCWTER